MSWFDIFAGIVHNREMHCQLSLKPSTPEICPILFAETQITLTYPSKIIQSHLYNYTDSFTF